MAADETRPAGINNEPGVATAECAEPTVDTSHTADQTLQCCSQPLLQITRETPYSHYPESENTHCSTLLQRERRVHWGLSFRRQLASELRCEAAALFYFRDQTESRELMTSALSTDQSSGHCLLLHHLTHHLTTTPFQPKNLRLEGRQSVVLIMYFSCLLISWQSQNEKGKLI